MIEVKKLSNGITLVSEAMPAMESAAIGFWTRTGAVNETEEIAGISHFIEHMMFKGTESRSAARVAEDMERIGGQMNAFTSNEMTCYYTKTLASNLEEGLEILLDMFLHSAFDAEEMEREKKVIYEEMKMVRDTPDEDAHETIEEVIFRNAPYGHSVLGTEETLGGIQRETLLDYWRRQYSRDSIVVALAGKFDEERIVRRLEEALSGLAASKEGVDLTSEVPAPAYRVKCKDIEQSHLCLATRALSMKDERYYSYNLFSSLLGGGMSSRLFQNVRERKGLAYSVYSSMRSFSEDGYFNIYAGVSHEKIGEAIEAIREEVAGIARDGVGEEELAKAKEQAKSSIIFGQESVNGRMFGLGRSMTLLGEAKSQEELLARVDAVSREDIGEAAASLGDLNDYSAVAVTREDFDLEALCRK